MCREEKERHGVVSTQRWRENVRVFDLRQKRQKEKKEKKRNNRQERRNKRKKRERRRGERKEEGDNQIGQAKKQEEI